MSKITLNATTFDLISTLSLDDIKLLEKQNPDALAIKDKDGDVQFVVKTGGTMGSISQYGIVFANKTRDGKAVLTYTLDTNKPADEQLNEIFDKVGAAKAKLDEIAKFAGFRIVPMIFDEYGCLVPAPAEEKHPTSRRRF